MRGVSQTVDAGGKENREAYQGQIVSSVNCIVDSYMMVICCLGRTGLVAGNTRSLRIEPRVPRGFGDRSDNCKLFASILDYSGGIRSVKNLVFYKICQQRQKM